MSNRAGWGKATVLEWLAPRLRRASILPLVHFQVAEWQQGRAQQLERLARQTWFAGPLIVRSSAVVEDQADHSHAGRFTSIADVVGADLPAAIDRVVASYRDVEHPENRVLVQPMLRQVAFSGVVFSQDPNTGSPYLVINLEEGADTAAVTGGRGGHLRTWYHGRHGMSLPNAAFACLVPLVEELEALLGCDALDIELAGDREGRLYVFQVRPLVMTTRRPAEGHRQLLADAAAKIAAVTRPNPFLHGRRTVLGIMPDWNPAEIIGLRPRPLALSLYRDIVTDSVWAYQRHNYGYRNLRSFPLMLNLHGLPYIDVRVSFNSFVPADVEPGLAARLIDYYIDRLIEAPALHDKVEFEVVFSCYTFDLPDRIRRLHETGFSEADTGRLIDSLRRLTNRIIDSKTGLWRQDLARVDALLERRSQVLHADLDPVARIYWLLEDCKRYGTLPFAGLARAGFIAVQMLRSLVAIGVLSEADVADFMAGLDTVSTRMQRDLAGLSREAFLAEYGRLRPGTYDILSPRYDEAPDLYFDWQAVRREARPPEPPRFRLSLEQMRGLSRLLDEHALSHDVVGLFDFIEAGIRGREYAKFVFSQNVSDALSLFGELGERHGFTREDMSFADIGVIYRLHSGCDDIAETLGAAIAAGRARYDRTTSLVMPPLIVGDTDVWSFEMPPTEPTFVSRGRVTGPVAVTAAGAAANGDLAGRIVLIPNADPGFDWIFTRGILGFVTAYGGVNSHMAIRAGELGLPAVIGAGESLYTRWAKAKVLEIDTTARQVRVLQ